MKKFVSVALLIGLFITGSISFGGQLITPAASTGASRGVTSVESPDKILAGDASGFSISSFGLDIDADASVGQIISAE
jgi:hypothetical protein